MEIKTITIPEDNLVFLLGKIEDLNKIARKMSVEPIEIREIRRYFKKFADDIEGEVYFKFVDLEMTKTDVIVQGYEVIASVDVLSDGNLIKAYKDYPVEYRDKVVCEHCNKKRYRKYAIIVRNIETNEYKMVGKSCVKDFFGGAITESDLHYISNFFSDIEDPFEDAPHRRGNYKKHVSIARYLSYVSACIKHYGFYKNAQYAYDHFVESTANESYNAMFPYITRDYKGAEFKPDEEDAEKAEKAVEWVRSLDDEVIKNNNYLYNINLLVKNEMMEIKHTNLVASILPSYFKEMERKEKREAEKKEKQISNHVGEVGDKLKEIEVIYEKGFSFDSMYGLQYIHKFRDLEGNVYVWKSGVSLFEVREKDRVKLSGRIKDHDIYNEERQTVLTRCKILADELVTAKQAN